METSGAGTARKKRDKKKPGDYSLSLTEEQIVVDYVKEAPLLWDRSRQDFKKRDLKAAAWEELARLIEKTVEHTCGWWKSQRDTYVRITRRKQRSGSGQIQLTEREEWLMTALAFMEKLSLIHI